jgi:hypothetical protein
MINEELMSKVYTFQGEEFNYFGLKTMTTIKTYHDTNHKTISLVSDEKGKLFLYDFDEYVSFDSRGDVMNEVYSLVRDTADADDLVARNVLKRAPFIHVLPSFEIVIAN